MSQLLIPDAGPLFSLAAGNLLPLLAHFRVGLSDMVCEETVDRGRLPGASIEAQRLRTFYEKNTAQITVFQTQVGVQIAAQRARNPSYSIPANLGELSIQSLLIDLQISAPGSLPVVLFEDGWFLANARALAKPCLLLSTQAFLEYAQEKQWITSAVQAREAIGQGRPGAYGESVVITHQGAGA